ncbi:hypothetical protein [Gracilimonas sp.]|uniref:hypothetical protein n=1 Tax=Gracilimonas sp. TaxID=1974203 RepID=UPI00287227FC|nr:hypothetical protein [Gracilimonas sp.]
MYASYYDKPAKEWSQYAKEISNGKISSLDNTVLLVLTTNECSPSIDELKEWNKFKKLGNAVNVEMIILEKYSTTVKVLLEQENINLTAYQDSTYKILENDLLPATPMKVYFGENGEVEKLGRIGGDRDPNKFIDKR